jgi:hypothetical protein
MARGEKPKAGSIPERLHRTVDVPQADRLENVRQLAAAVRDGIQYPAALREMLDVDDRHFAYYRQAAIILGVVATGRDGALVLSERGRDLLAAAEGSPDERRVFLEAMRSARALKPFASFFDGEEVSKEDLAARLQTFTGLSTTTALRRAHTLIRWRNYAVPTTGVAAGPVVPDLALELDARVRRHNALAKQEARTWLEKMAPRDFEKLVAELLKKMDCEDVKVVGGAGDGGIDISALAPGLGGRREPMAVQAKRYAAAVGPGVVRELIGTLGTGHYTKAMLVTTSDFSSQARETAERDRRIQLYTGMELVELLAKHGVALSYGRFGEIVRRQG